FRRCFEKAVGQVDEFKGEGGEQQCQAVCCVVEAGWSCLRLLADKLGHHSGLQEVEPSQLQALMSHTLLCHPQTQVPGLCGQMRAWDHLDLRTSASSCRVT
ncbi:hypothetical protein ATANTOWER_011499, partial [Ataeniobius toweri]|nr:hypothetical protein [Ataeniobius toweri]